MLKKLLIFLLMSLPLMAKTTDKFPEQHSQAYVSVINNPVTYIAGYIQYGNIFEHNGKIYTQINLQLLSTMQLYQRTITFCGNQTNEFSGKGLIVLLSYSRVMHEDCYYLYSVDRIIQ